MTCSCNTTADSLLPIAQLFARSCRLTLDAQWWTFVCWKQEAAEALAARMEQQQRAAGKVGAALAEAARRQEAAEAEALEQRRAAEELRAAAAELAEKLEAAEADARKQRQAAVHAQAVGAEASRRAQASAVEADTAYQR